MYTLVVILILIVSVLLSLIVLVQNSKGGGLVSNFGGANQMMGVRQTTDFLEKATWTMAGILVVLCLISSITLPKGSKDTYPMKFRIIRIRTIRTRIRRLSRRRRSASSWRSSRRKPTRCSSR